MSDHCNCQACTSHTWRAEAEIAGAGLQPFQQRVVAERDELTLRTQKLMDFMDTDTFRGLGLAERARLYDQASAMTQYGNALAARIAAFGETP